MKKCAFFAIFAVLGISCAYAKPATVTLDAAIREASKEINTALPAGTKVALLNFSSDSDAFSDYVIEEMSIALVRGKKLVIVDRKEIELIRREMDFQMSGDVSDESAQQIGAMLGAQSIISGSMVNVGDSYRFRTKVINVVSAAIQTSSSINVKSDKQVTYLLSQGKKAPAPQAMPVAATAQGSTQVQPASTKTQTQPQGQTAVSFPLVGLWKVTGRDSVNWTGNMVIDEIDGDRFSGYFEWRGGIDYGGREYFRGVHDSKNKKVTIKGYRLADDRGLGLGTYEAYLTRSGDLESGIWGGGSGTWEAKWQN
jgi:TolB-like protein